MVKAVVRLCTGLRCCEEQNLRLMLRTEGYLGAIKTTRASPVRNCAKLCCLLALQATDVS